MQKVLGDNTKPYILVAPAHISEDTYPEYTRIYTDSSKDLAIYYNNAYVPENIPEIGKIVSSADGKIQGEVVDFDDYSFYFVPNDDVQIMKGDSGAAMYFYDEYVGYISSISLDGRVRVVCY